MLDVLEYIDLFFVTKGYAPTRRDIMAGVDGLNSTSSVQYNLILLENQGLISMDPGSARAIRIEPEGYEILRSAS